MFSRECRASVGNWFLGGRNNFSTCNSDDLRVGLSELCLRFGRAEVTLARHPTQNRIDTTQRQIFGSECAHAQTGGQVGGAVYTCDALSAAHMQHMQMRTEARSPLVGSEHDDMCISVHVVHRNTQEYIRIYVAISMFGFRSVKSPTTPEITPFPLTPSQHFYSVV